MNATKNDIVYPRPYIRDGVPGLPIERQREMLRDAGIGVSDDRALYIDRLAKVDIRSRNSAALEQRDKALRPRNQGETVCVAGLRVLDWTMSGIARCLLVAMTRGANIYCADTDMTYSAEMPGPVLLDALASAEEAYRRSVAQDKQERATSASQKKRARDKERKLAEARPLWRNREYTVEEIAAKVGLSRGTLYTALGPRWEPEKGTKHA